MKWERQYNESDPTIYGARIEVFVSLLAHEIVEFNKTQYDVHLEFKKVVTKLNEDWLRKPGSIVAASHTLLERFIEYEAWTEEDRLRKESMKKLKEKESFDRTKL